MTDIYQTVGSIRRSLVSIRDHYDMALIPPSRVGMKEPTKAVTGEKMKYAGKTMRHSPPPVDVGVLQARIAAHSDLSHYCRVILFEVTDINGRPIQTKLRPDDPVMLAWFVDTWAQRLVEQVPLEAEVCERDLAKHARVLKHLALPSRRDWMPIGDCPVTIADADGNSVPCGAKVRAYDRTEVESSWSSSSETSERKLKRIQFIKCPGCGTEDTLGWWMSQIMPEGSDLATATEVITYVAMHAGVIIRHDQIRQWASRDHIQRHGKDDKGRTLYSSGAVLAYAKDQIEEEAA